MPTYSDMADYSRNTIMGVLFDSDIKGKTGWESCSVAYHVYRALNHLGLFLIGDYSENHLSNAQTRLSMAAWLYYEKGKPQGEPPVVRSDEFTSGELDR